MSKFDRAVLAQWRDLAADMERTGEGGSALHQHCKARIAEYEAQEAPVAFTDDELRMAVKATGAKVRRLILSEMEAGLTIQ